MEFKEFCKERERMCKDHECGDCPLIKVKKLMSIGGTCNEACMENVDEAEKIVSEWSKEYPIVTNRDKFKEVFGFDIAITARGSIFLYINDYISKEDWLAQEYKPPQK